jgi:hypothetical protein
MRGYMRGAAAIVICGCADRFDANASDITMPLDLRSVVPKILSKRTFLVPLALSLALIYFLSFHIYADSNPWAVPLHLHPDSLSTTIPQHPPPPTTTTTTTTTGPRILLVSAFFPLPKAKHSISEYMKWQKRYLSCITTEIYFFTTPEVAPFVLNLRGSLPITINTTFSSPFSIPPLHGLQPRYKDMHNWDREKRRHSPELYAVWNGKPYFLEEAVKNTRLSEGKEWDYAFWTDAGSFRKEFRCGDWPDPARVQEVWEEGSRKSGKEKEELLFFPMTALPHRSMKDWKEDMGPVDYDFSEGRRPSPFSSISTDTHIFQAHSSVVPQK